MKSMRKLVLAILVGMALVTAPVIDSHACKYRKPYCKSCCVTHKHCSHKHCGYKHRKYLKCQKHHCHTAKVIVKVCHR